MTTFYNPYQFIPATGKINGKSSAKTDYKVIKSGNSHIRHDVWVPGTYSGKVVCTLTTASPTFVGAYHTEQSSSERAKTVPHYQRQVNDVMQPAIPGNSLRGVISQCMETLSQSTLRVLEDKIMSVRKSMPKEGASQEGNELLYGIGLIKKKLHSPESEDKDDYQLLPLCVSTQLEIGDEETRGLGVICDKNLPWSTLFKGRRLSECLPAYVDSYEHKRRINHLQSLDPKAYPYPDANTYYYAKLPKCLSFVRVGENFEWSVEMKDSVYHIQRRLLAQKHQGIVSAEKYKELTAEEQREYTRGLMRVLDMDKYGDVIPNTKKRELFIPFPEELEKKIKPLDIPAEVLKTYKALVLESMERSKDRNNDRKLPVTLRGYDNAEVADNRLFYFGCKCETLAKEAAETEPETEAKPVIDVVAAFKNAIKNKEKPDEAKLKNEPEKKRIYTISEISITSLWRKRIEDSLYAFFQSSNGDSHLTPWRDDDSDSSEPPRQLTPVEVIMGFVSDGIQQGSKEASALASRVRFSDALPLPDSVQPRGDLFSKEKYTLKILDSPKPPSPSMYFHDRNKLGKYISKTGLQANNHQANGRKYYLHHPKAIRDVAENTSSRPPWQTVDENKRLKQKVRVCPIRQGVSFSFDISFENLSSAELDLLLTAIKPSNSCLHHLGMGKPLGLGSIRMDIAGVYLINRHQRYQADRLFAPRFNQVWLTDAENAVAEAANSKYLSQSADSCSLNNAMKQLQESAQGDERLVDAYSHELLCFLMSGNAVPENANIHYPLAVGQPEEDEGFKWFVANDKSNEKQMLEYIELGNVPTLQRISE